MLLPIEIIDNIVYYTNDFDIISKLGSYYIFNKVPELVVSYMRTLQSDKIPDIIMKSTYDFKIKLLYYLLRPYECSLRSNIYILSNVHYITP